MGPNLNQPNRPIQSIKTTIETTFANPQPREILRRFNPRSNSNKLLPIVSIPLCGALIEQRGSNAFYLLRAQCLDPIQTWLP